MSDKPQYKVIVGSKLTLDGHKWHVEAKELDGYLVSGGDGEQTVLSFKRIDDAINAGLCEVSTPKQTEDRNKLHAFTGGFDDLDQVPQQEQRNARARMALVLAMEKLEQNGQKLTHRYLDQPLVRKGLFQSAIEISQNERLFDGVDLGPTRKPKTEPDSIVPKGRTLAKCLSDFRKYGRKPIALINRHHLKGVRDPERACKLKDWQIDFVQYVCKHLNKPTKPKLAPVYEAAKALFTTSETDIVQGRTYPSVTTVRNWNKKLSNFAKQIGLLGLRQARNRFGAGATDVRSLMYGERAATDQVYLSIFVDADGACRSRRIDPHSTSEQLAPNEVMRLWLHVMIDVATRLPLAWILSKTTDADHTMALLRMATRDKTKEKVRYGCKRDPAPAAGLLLTVADNGTATRNKDVYSSQMGLGSMVQTGRTYHSTDNPHAERFFSTLQFGVLNFEGGYVGSGPGDLPGYDPKANTHLTTDALYGVITRAFVDEYSHTAHKGTGMNGASPDGKLAEVMAMYGGIEPPSPEVRRISLGYKKTLTTSSEGVLFSIYPYNSIELQKFHDGVPKKVTVYIDPDFKDVATIQPANSPKKFSAALTLTALDGLSFEEGLAVAKTAAENNSKRQALTNDMLLEARAARAKSSGFFKEPRRPESYSTEAQLQKQADALAGVAIVPARTASAVPTLTPGEITRRFPVETPSVSPQLKNAPVSKTIPGPYEFPPITESKL